MNKYLFILCIACYILINTLHAQHAYFPLKGVITYEKEVYTRARLREMSNKANSQNRGMMMRFGGNIEDVPEKSSTMFTLQFDEDETLMLSMESDESTTTSGRNSGNMSGGVGRSGRPQNNARPPQMARMNMRGSQSKIFYQNLKESSSAIQLEIDEKYILNDSLQRITWRFTNEYRDIAGYECRRVNGSTPDSLYIVAFYTDQIPISGGPALVHGLPGMILGIAIPEMHINYWARKVDFVVDNISKSWRDKKSKEMTMENFFKSLENNRAFGGGGSSRSQTRRNLLENLIY